jgi:hypothetical protein
MTLHTTIDLARRVDRAEIEFCALAGSTHGPIDVCDAAGGRALFSRPGSPLNKMLGLGLSGPVTDADLDMVEAFYAARRAPAQIELCPLACSDLAARLCRRGFIVDGFENELGMALAPVRERVAPVPGVDVTIVPPGRTDAWVRIVAEGFAAYEPPVGGGPEGNPLSIEQMVEMMSQFGHPGITRYLASIDGEPAGGGAAWSHGGVLGIFGTSTLPRFRRRGVQAAVTIAALEGARGAADVATATTAPGSTSQRTFERLGFVVLYTRAVFVKT